MKWETWFNARAWSVIWKLSICYWALVYLQFFRLGEERAPFTIWFGMEIVLADWLYFNVMKIAAFYDPNRVNTPPAEVTKALSRGLHTFDNGQTWHVNSDRSVVQIHGPWNPKRRGWREICLDPEAVPPAAPKP